MWKALFICRVIFKSQVKPLLKARAFIQPREDMIKVLTHVQQAMWAQQPSSVIEVLNTANVLLEPSRKQNIPELQNL